MRKKYLFYSRVPSVMVSDKAVMTDVHFVSRYITSVVGVRAKMKF